MIPLGDCSAWSTGYHPVHCQACIQPCLFLQEMKQPSEIQTYTTPWNNTEFTPARRKNISRKKMLHLHVTWKKSPLTVSCCAIAARSSCFFTRRCKGRHSGKGVESGDDEFCAKIIRGSACVLWPKGKLTTFYDRRYPRPDCMETRLESLWARRQRCKSIWRTTLRSSMVWN